MKIEINRDDLVYAVSAVERAVSTKNTIPALGGVLISAAADRISFRATDLELAMECVVPGRVLEAGEAVTSGRRFSAIVRLLPAGDVTLSGDALHLELEYAGGHQALPCLPAEEFPLLPSAEGELQGTIPVREFRRLVRQAGIAAAADEVRPIFSGILTEFAPGEITMVATDTHRLTKATGAWQGSGEGRLLIPCRTLQEVARLAVNEDDNIIITGGKSQVFFSFANLTFTSRLIMGQFPNYKDVIPADDSFSIYMFVNRIQLSQALERASLVSRETGRGRGSVVRFEVGDCSLTISAEVPDEGTIREQVACTTGGGELTVNFNARYLLDMLKAVDEDMIEMRLSGPASPCVLLPDMSKNEDGSAGSYLYLLLPVRVNNR
ncbi:MAG: DNA polymerase III subunit beta [Firmicutes bacterium]|nr:DNA polymerase III subunit beta [Bacillota bacterium]